ncbi:FAD-dependent oxidoreductase [uncultured Hymenobacter sp.]|uniref:FAD-dependent oxidoreductase n=1 Tax=uncultured Hymenobacter sp. TaxID=170016 RepID=UPI0035CB53EB
MSDTSLPWKFETDVLVVGSGPAGSTMAALLSTYGIRNVVITKYSWLANTPRAHITNQRTMEVFRDLGIEADIMAQAVPQALMGNNVFCESLAGEELGRLHSWGTHPSRLADYTLASPTSICDIPQTLVEPILLTAAGQRGTRFRFDTEYLSLVQDEAGVTATVRDRLSGEVYQIRAKYLVGADGSNSRVAADVGLPLAGQMGVGGSINIVCNMDLARYVAHRPSVLYWVLQPGSNVGGIGMGLVRMVRPWNEWLIVWGYDIAQGPPQLSEREAIEIVHNLIGDDTIPVTIRSTSAWTVNHCYATELSHGRVFCVGDAIHRHPPSNGLGSNTSVQDSFNLAWKLAYVLKGLASPAQLASYQAERAPVARQIVERANKSIGEFGPIFDALGLTNTADPAQMQANMAARKNPGAAAAQQRARLHQAIQAKTYEFNCHGVELNQRYASAAIVADGTAPPAWRRDEELYYQATTWPGARLPHAWLGHHNNRVSTLDLAGHGQFTLLTGLGGEAWVAAAQAIAAARGLPLTACLIGPGCPYEDLYGEWADLREIEESGCLLIRPDLHVAWRQFTVAPDAHQALAAAITHLLGQ